MEILQLYLTTLRDRKTSAFCCHRLLGESTQGIHDVGAEGNDEEDDGVAPDYDLRESVADDEQLDGMLEQG